MNNIENIKGVEILDSRGKPTLLVGVSSSGLEAFFAVPSGASTGENEAYELRDEKGGMSSAIYNIENIIKEKLVGISVFDQFKIDQTLIELDNTKNKSFLGANTILGISIACAKLSAMLKNISTFEYLKELNQIEIKSKVPYLYMNLINGGKHAQNNLAFQEYHIVPMVENPKEAVDIGLRIFNSLKEIVKQELGEESLIFGDEGGLAPKISDIRMPLVLLKKAVEENKLENKIRFALDIAASSFFENGFYFVDGKKINSEELMQIYTALIEEFNILSIEDPFEENDFDNFKKLKSLYRNIIVVGDDLTVTNKDLLTKAINKDSVNGMIIKPNQIGTLSETFETIDLALKNNIKIIISHRSGETNDDFIADLSYAYSSFGLKAGAPTKPERLIKYNRLINISKSNE